MAEGTRVQFSTAAAWAIGGVFAASALLAGPLRALGGLVRNDPSDPAIAQSALGPVFIWCWGWPLAFATADDMARGRFHLRGMQFMWAFGSLLLLLHIAVAFHLGHGWSHAAARQHTQQASGFGGGTYVNYAVALVWVADAAWLCVASGSYFARPRWVSWTVHGFIAFIVVNAAVVFGSWQSRGMFVFGSVPAAALLTLRWWFDRKGEAPPPSAE